MKTNCKKLHCDCSNHLVDCLDSLFINDLSCSYKGFYLDLDTVNDSDNSLYQYDSIDVYQSKDDEDVKIIKFKYDFAFDVLTVFFKTHYVTIRDFSECDVNMYSSELWISTSDNRNLLTINFMNYLYFDFGRL